MNAPILPGAEPVSIRHGSQGAVLLLHGYMGTVQAVRDWALALGRAGFAVEAPLLPGHGTSHEDMLGTGWDTYVDYADDCYKKLVARHGSILIGGLCLGGSLAASVATRHPESVAGLIIVNGSFQLPTKWNADYLREMLKENRKYFPWFRGRAVEDPQSPPMVGYELAPIEPLLTLRPNLELLYPQLSTIQAPILAFTSRLDTVLLPGEDIPGWTREVAGKVEHIWLERSRHVATMDYDKDIVETRSVEFALTVTQNRPQHLAEQIA